MRTCDGLLVAGNETTGDTLQCCMNTLGLPAINFGIIPA